MKLKQHLKRLLRNKEFEKEFCIPDAGEILMIRKLRGLTQKQLAKKVGTAQSAISRLENNSDSVTLKFVGKIAYALEKHFSKLRQWFCC